MNRKKLKQLVMEESDSSENDDSKTVISKGSVATSIRSTNPQTKSNASGSKSSKVEEVKQPPIKEHRNELPKSKKALDDTNRSINPFKMSEKPKKSNDSSSNDELDFSKTEDGKIEQDDVETVD